MALAGREWGTLPTPTNWLGIEGKFRGSSYPMSAAFGVIITQRTRAEFVDVSVGAQFQAVIAQARLCVEPTTKGWFVEACGGAQLSVVRAKGYANRENLGRNGISGADEFTTYRWIPGPMMTLAVGYEIANALSLKSGATLAIPSQRWQFVVENVGRLYESAEVQKLLYVGLGACFD